MLAGILGLVVAIAGQDEPRHGSEQWRTFHEMCGRLVSVQKIVHGEGKTVDEKWKSLKKVPLELYARGNETACCEGLSVTAKTVTGRSGDFDFKKLSPGTYWVVARWNDNVYQLPITFTPGPKDNTDCSLQGLSINSEGSFDRWTTIVLDSVGIAEQDSLACFQSRVIALEPLGGVPTWSKNGEPHETEPTTND